MNSKPISKSPPVALITGAAQRIGAEIAERLHAAGYNIVIHYRNSEAKAVSLTQKLNAKRKNSTICMPADLNNMEEINQLAKKSIETWGRMDALINCASSFFPTPIGGTSEQQWDELISSNMKAPFFLAQALKQAIAEQNGSIVNIADIYAEKPLASHTVYCMAKAGNVMLTKSLATELAPQVRVNGIAPGAILWPENGGAADKKSQKKILDKVPLARAGSAKDIADTVLFLLRDGPYITGQIIAVDGGRNLHI